MRGARREHVSSLYRRRRLVEVASVAAALWPEPASLWEASSAALHEWNPRVSGVTRGCGHSCGECAHRGQKGALRAAPRSTSPRHSAAPPRSRSIGTSRLAASDVTVLPRRQVTAEAGARGREPPTEARPQHECTESDTAWHHEEEWQHKDGKRARCCKIQHVGAIHADVHDEPSGASHDQAAHALQNGVWPTRHPP